MATLLKWVGGIWAVMGLGNLVLMPWTTAGEGLLIAGLMFNVLLFVIPGLIVYGIGAAITKKPSLPEDVPTSSFGRSNSKTSEERLGELLALRDKGLITPQEYENRRQEILRQV